MAAVEIKLFCIVSLAALYVFKTYFSNLSTKADTPLFVFSILGTVFSLISDFLTDTYLQALGFALCAISYAVASLFLLQTLKAVIRGPVAVAVIAATFFSMYCGLSLAVYAFLFAVVAVFIFRQHDTIRIDNLTKLHNRYGMDMELKEQLRQYNRENTDSFYIIACDLDNFKHINDTWGHPEGDRALVLVANVLAKVSKQFCADVFRIGGDEFVIIADTSDEKVAQAITAAIQNELNTLVFRDDFTINMSLGTALYNGEDPIDDVLKKADKKLYEAKRS